MKKKKTCLLNLTLCFILLFGLIGPLGVRAISGWSLVFTVEDSSLYKLTKNIAGNDIIVTKLAEDTSNNVDSFLTINRGQENISNEVTIDCSTDLTCTVIIPDNYGDVNLSYQSSNFDVTRGDTKINPGQDITKEDSISLDIKEVTQQSNPDPGQGNNNPNPGQGNNNPNPGQGNNDSENPSGPNFDGKTYLVWSCGTGTCYHYFDNMPVNNSGVFISSKTIEADNKAGEKFNVHADNKFFASKDDFEEWVAKYKAANNGSIDWTKVKTESMMGQGQANYRPVGEPYLNNAFVSYADRNFKAIIYNDTYRAISIGTLEGLTYYPGAWQNELTRQDSYDLSGTSKSNPVEIKTVLLESTINLKELGYNGLEIKSIEALDVPSNAVKITNNNDGSFKLVFASRFYDNVVFKVTDKNNKNYYVKVVRQAITAKVDHRGKKVGVYATMYFDRKTTYTDYLVTSKIVYKDGTSKIVEMKNSKNIDDGLDNHAYVYELDEENHPEYRDFPVGKGLKQACYEYELTQEELKKIDKIYVNVEFKGSTSDNYAGAYVGSGNGVVIEVGE